jgi:cell division protein FtsQ
VTRRKPPASPDASSVDAELPGSDVPSPEVLDELLKAFSANEVDTATLRKIDLGSPEVDELLAPTEPTPAPEGEVEPEPRSQQEVESPSKPEHEPEAEPDTTDAPATPSVIRIDASDDPPDAVYLAAGDPLLAESAAGRGLAAAAAAQAVPDRGGEGTVFIDDQDVGLGETISLADAATATRIEPRLRDRRIAVKRAAGRKRLRWMLLATGILAVVVAVLAVLGSSWFSVKTVKVEGAVYTDKVALQRVVDELRGTPVLRVDTAKAERELEAIAWVEAARVTAKFPDRATIELRERTAVATYQGPDLQFRVIDGKGRVLDVLAAQPAGYLLLVGADAPNLSPGQFTPPGFVAAASLARALTPEVRAIAESAAVTADGSDLRLTLDGDVEVRFGPARDLVTKLVRLQTKLDDVVSHGYSYVDVSTNEVTVG